MSQTKIITCPECLHNFTVGQSVSADKRMMADLVKAGYSYREIGKKFNEHPQTVKYWAEKLNEPNVEESEL